MAVVATGPVVARATTTNGVRYYRITFSTDQLTGRLRGSEINNRRTAARSNVGRPNDVLIGSSAITASIVITERWRPVAEIVGCQLERT